MSALGFLAGSLFGLLLLAGSTQTDEIPANARLDGAIKLNIQLEGSLQNPAFSPDGRQIVFTRFRDGYNLGPSDLFVFQISNGALRALVSDGSANINLPGAAWNGTRKSIVFSSDRGAHDEIFIIAANGKPGDEVQLTNRFDLQAFEPSYSPFGRWVVFESHEIDVEAGTISKVWHDGGRQIVKLSEVGQVIKQPNWSPRGDKILYQQLQDGDWAIWSMNVDGSQKLRLTPQGWSATDAVFLADGSGIVFSAENQNIELANIFRAQVSGGVPEALTQFEGYDGAPSISNDGSLVVFESSVVEPDESVGTSLWMKGL